MPTWQPQDTEIEKLRKAIVDERSKYNEQDVVAALQRYPGSLGQIELFPNRYTTAELIDSCLKGIQKDNDYHKLSFMLRLTEQKWDFEAFRTKLVTDLPAIVRPPRGFKEQIELVSAALGELIGRVPEAPNGTNIVDVATFERLCQRRSAIEAFAAALAELEALKSLHDSLHMLQVLGADWLAGAPTDPEREDTATVLALLRQIATVAGNVAPTLSAAGRESCERSLEGSNDASGRIKAGAPTEIALARATLRAILARELALIDGEMFRVSRDLPLREFLGLLVETHDLPAIIAGREAALDMADTLRRRLMEHALWQAQDGRFSAAEQALSLPSATFIADLQRCLKPAIDDLRALLDRSDIQRLLAPMNDAMLNYSMLTAGDDETALRGRIEDAFANLRSGARTLFLLVDQMLRQDFAALVALRSRLQTILQRMPPYCGTLVETYRDRATP